MATQGNLSLTYSKLAERIRIILTEEKARKQERRLRGEDFNIFEVMRMQNDEVYTHSAIIASLLDSRQSHGCGLAFLDLFLKYNE